ncbi:pyridoxal phosphate-dependent aminotransferase [filamentous cyanobacterium LEGE 11480]|uniref:Pyridoxal phosphate-dependent aminotransferase n=1 Tax=Romeriopsis navalis LEGE 11480 TaxID=2777977 RepID=A0A928VQ87_9CYAN|nr:pyridoxal phosphate-dependent aminotransferase [Romeriopsis navalis]MBE9030926.1 pyridoxal phosphate-dependent aminotransferase [Romeriopsis navalis LEGE 11480]
MQHISRMQAIQSPIIPIVGEWIRQTPGTISLGQGVVSYAPPPEAMTAISRAFEHPQNHKYQAVEGIPELQAAIRGKLQQDNQIPVTDAQQIIVTAGSNMAFVNTVLAITQPGDEIILQTPYYFNHEMAIGMASCQAVLVPTDGDYQLQLDKIKAAITEKTRAIVTISPNNPTGAVYPREDLLAVNQLCREAGIYHVSDEAYDYFTYGVSHTSPGAFSGSANHTISLFSLSKAYGFASWRIGYMVIPAHLHEAVRKIQDTILICPPVVSQYAALGALQFGRLYCDHKINQIESVRESVLRLLAPLSDCCLIPEAQGAFYFFLKVDTAMSAMTLAERLVREYQVAVIPGETFGMVDGCYLRVAYGALDPESAVEGIGRLVKGIVALV